MDLNNVCEKFKAGSLSIDESRSLLNSVITKDVYEKALKDFLLQEFSELIGRVMNILLVLNELQILENDSAALIKLYEIPIMKDLSDNIKSDGRLN
ncbi:MAG: hypothetical protein HXY50_00495 [Ignavibacteriaceae bacterium]|nr:hypothetical protein [Ignavibacteriaceae bacterium]